MSKVIVHIDLNAFFVRCEEIKEPSLEGQAVAIGHDGRGGIVSTCSYKAREYGVSSGMPMFKAKNLCPNLLIIPGDHRFYWALSAQFINFVKRYTKIVEIASIDECYADFSEALKGQKDVVGYFKRLQNDLFKETGLRCSIGVAPTKFLAKMGSDYKKPMGLTIIRKKDIKKILYPLSIDKMFGIGKKSTPKMISMGIKTIGDLGNLIEKGEEECLRTIGNFYYYSKECLSGNSDDVISLEPEELKSIGHSSTFPYDTNNINEIDEMLSLLSKQVSNRAVKHNKVGTTIQIVAKESDFTVHNKSKSFDNPTNKYEYIFRVASSLYHKYFNDLTVRLVGVTLQNLIDTKDMTVQMSLFDYEKHEEENETRLLIDELNRRLDKPSIIRASEVKKEKKNGNK